MKLEIAVNDEYVKPTIEAIVEGGRTGSVGDGKIFCNESRRVRQNQNE